MFQRREQKLKDEVHNNVGLPRQFKVKESVYEVDVITDTEELWTDQYDSKASSDVFLAHLQKEMLLDYTETFIKCMGNTRNYQNILWKPCIPPFPLHALVLLSGNYLQERMEKLPGQVSSDGVIPSISSHLHLRV